MLPKVAVKDYAGMTVFSAWVARGASGRSSLYFRARHCVKLSVTVKKRYTDSVSERTEAILGRLNRQGYDDHYIEAKSGNGKLDKGFWSSVSAFAETISSYQAFPHRRGWKRDPISGY